MCHHFQDENALSEIVNRTDESVTVAAYVEDDLFFHVVRGPESFSNFCE